MDAEQIEKLKKNGRRGYSQYDGGKRIPIPELVIKNTIQRDKVCVYCREEFKNNSCDKATWEHIDNNANHVDECNIVLCCKSCNSSKREKIGEEFLKWLNSDYCRGKNKMNKKVDEKKVANVVIKYINRIRRGIKK